MQWPFLLFILISSIVSSAEPLISLNLWHAFDDPSSEIFQKIVNDFNHQSGTYCVVLTKIKDYKHVYQAGLNAYLGGKPPHMLHVYEIATLNAMRTPSFFKSVGELLSSFHQAFDPDVYIDSIRNSYSDSQGKMLSFPWNASTGVLFYNKKAFADASLPDLAPKTWEEFETYAAKLLEKTYKGFATTWSHSYCLERICAKHNQPFATHANGFEGLSARLCFNQPLQIHHLNKLMSWQEGGFYQHAKDRESEILFLSGKCAMLLGETTRLSFLRSAAGFEIGVGPMPYWAQFTSDPHNLTILGASFWVFSGFTEAEYRGVVHFFRYLSSSEVQTYWHQKSGHLPITEAAYYLAKKNGIYANDPSLEVPVLEVLSKRPTPNTTGIRLGGYVFLCDVIAESLEKAFSNEIKPKEALDLAVEKGNELLEAYQARVY